MNPIDLEIYWNRLIAITDEAGAALKRTSFSTVVRESNDFACVLLDSQARLLAQSSLSIPGFIGTAPLSLRAMLQRIPKESLQPGDILFTNDPWIGTGHLPDATMAAPVFAGGRLIAFVPDRPGHDSRYALDAGQIERELGWRPQESFDSGLRKTVLWYLEHRDWCERVQGAYRRERLGLPSPGPG